jgi:phosphodiesterase/alkaline phosphatase D-like protein
LRDLPWIHVFDDHELINDYYPEMAGGEVNIISPPQAVADEIL